MLSNTANNDIGNVEGNKFFADANFKYHSIKNSGEKKLDVAFRYNDAQGKMFSLKEAFMDKKLSQSDLRIGRQVLDWSVGDQIWGFGFLNNRVNFDYFTPGQEGLVGVNWKKKFKNVHMELFGSALYVPELNPGLDTDNEDGSITSQNPWAKPPASSTEINDSDVAIKYNVNMPPISEILLRPTVGIKLAYDFENSKHFLIEGFYIKKPENKVTTAAEIVYINAQEAVSVNITPQVFYHNVFGANFIYKNSNYQAHAGTVSHAPDSNPDGNELVTDYTAIETEKIREDYFVSGIKFFRDDLTWAVNYVARISSYDKADDFLAQNPRWSQAFNLSFQKRFSRTFLLSSDLKYDTLTTDRLFMLRGDLRLTASSVLSAGVNLIHTDDGEDTYWSDFKNNDAVYGAFTLKF